MIPAPTYLAKIDDKNYTIPKHIRFIEEQLLDIVNGSLKRLIVTVPPRHGKSYLISKYFPAFFLYHFPYKKIILSSYESNFASYWVSKVLPLLRLINVPLIAERKNFIETAQGGYMQGVGVGGAITGKGADLFIIDDPVKNSEEALSTTYRNKTWDWFLSVASTRLEPNAAMIIIMTRWHKDDLAGRVIESQKNKWTVINLPAIAGVDDVLGRTEGEALWPERFPIERLLEEKSQGEYWFNALYQQNPIEQGSQIIKSEWWQFFDDAPTMDYVFQSYDTAFKLGEMNDFTAGVTIGLRQGNYYILDYINKKVEFPDLLNLVKTKYEQWRPSFVLIEDKGSGQSLIQQLKRDTNLPIKDYKPQGDKVLRVNQIAPLFEQGKVFIRRGLNDIVNQFNDFPFGAHDDIVDAVTQVLLNTRNYQSNGSTFKLNYNRKNYFTL